MVMMALYAQAAHIPLYPPRQHKSTHQDQEILRSPAQYKKWFWELGVQAARREKHWKGGPGGSDLGSSTRTRKPSLSASIRSEHHTGTRLL